MNAKCIHRITVFVVAAIISTVSANAQFVSGGSSDVVDLPPDTLRLTEEWWLGVNVAGNYALGFGTMTLTYIGGTAPDSPGISSTTEGGYGFGMSIAPSIEYRAIGSSLGLLLHAGVDYQYQTSRSSVPVTVDEYAYNATFEANTSILYGTVAFLAKYSFGGRGLFLFGGPVASLPLWSDSYIWQHETLPEGQDVGEQPGFPNTSIKFDTEPALRPRVGLQLGFGMDIMTGLFGYTGQLLSPYFMLQGATPVMSDPTAWNSLFVRMGVIWRTGI